MEGVDLFLDMWETLRAIDDVTDVLDRLDELVPQTEMAYQTRKREVELMLKSTEGATLARDTVRGFPEVAELRMERDRTRCERQSARERLASLRARLYALEGMARREWNRPEEVL